MMNGILIRKQSEPGKTGRGNFMKKIVIVISVLALILASCSSRKGAVKEVKSGPAVINMVSGRDLVGEVNRAGFETKPFDAWFSKNYRDYRLDRKKLAELKSLWDDTEVLIIMGTWCPDSRREIPRLYKILDNSGFDEKRLTVIAVDKAKYRKGEEPSGKYANLNIKRVPTIIILKKGKEIGRIIESPVFSLEKDLSLILSGKSYKPNYLDL